VSGGLYEKPPTWRYRIELAEGGQILADPRDCIRVIDSRTAPPHERPVTVWEVRVSGLVRRLWPEDIAAIEQEAI
jgi:hypothetical protein